MNIFFSRKILPMLLILAILYLSLGLGFHFKWERALTDCQEVRIGRGEYVEPRVYGKVIGLIFDVTMWPVYARANMYHDGTPFATPCTK